MKYLSILIFCLVAKAYALEINNLIESKEFNKKIKSEKAFEIFASVAQPKVSFDGDNKNIYARW